MGDLNFGGVVRVTGILVRDLQPSARSALRHDVREAPH
jgi:hypothetical protein